MQLTLYTDYALRVLLYLGLKSGERGTITEISRSYGISRNHLVKVVHQLGLLGYLDNLRGRAGGLALAMPPEKINIGEVVRKTEPNFKLVECFDMRTNTCPIAPVCALKGALYEAQKQFLDVLDRYTLADVLGNARDLKMLLRVPDSPPD